MPVGRPKGFDTADVLRRAISVFWQKGYDATTVKDLVSATGIGRQSLYNEFGDKRSLFAQAIQSYRDGETRYMIDLLQNAPTARDGLRAFFDAALDSGFDGARRGCFLTNSIAIRTPEDEELCALMDQSVNGLKTAFVGCIKRGIAAGEISDELDPDALGFLYFSQGQGLSVVGKCQTCRETADESIDLLLSLLDD
ncbi:MAG: TetR/AcrR family transcriptional regulator [Verrucomicrobiota bacterium]